MSSAWALGQVIVLGLGSEGQTARNLRDRRDLVISVPAPAQWQAVERLAPLTGRSPVSGAQARYLPLRAGEVCRRGTAARAL
jgi:flavin reductase (DIM6/NTAB) family NADH-FMN oxidoreductase RutF